jgi:hypothetical protein
MYKKALGNRRFKTLLKKLGFRKIKTLDYHDVWTREIPAPGDDGPGARGPVTRKRRSMRCPFSA